MSRTRFTAIAAIQVVGLMVSSQNWLDVDAVMKYPVYFDPNNEGEYRNPKGSGYQPVGPDNWNEVVSRQVPILMVVLRANTLEDNSVLITFPSGFLLHRITLETCITGNKTLRFNSVATYARMDCKIIINLR